MQNSYCLLLVPVYSGACASLVMAIPCDGPLEDATERFIRNPGAWTEVGRFSLDGELRAERLPDAVKELVISLEESASIYVVLDDSLPCFQSADSLEPAIIE